MCFNCDTSCLTCLGTTYSDCLSCNSSNVLQIVSAPAGTCTPCTGDGYNTVASGCVTCAASCRQCGSTPVDANKCTACYTLSLNKYLINDQCTDCSTPGFFIDQKNGVSFCKKCDPSCKTCSGPQVNQCTSCPTDRFKFQANNTCSLCLGNGFYQ